MDTVLSEQHNDPEIPESSLQRYREKAEYYVRKHQDESVIRKLHTNEPLTPEDVAELEQILWNDIGSEEDYRSEFGSKPLGVFVRELVGLDINAAKFAFSEFMDGASLTPEQYYFVNQIVEYVSRNGIIEDMAVLMTSPFTDRGSVADIFGSDMDKWLKIKQAIESINHNATISS